MTMQPPAPSSGGNSSETWRDILWSALRTFAAQPTVITPEITSLFDQALHHRVAHTYGDDWQTPFLYACDNGLTTQIRRMISAEGGRSSLCSIPSDYLDSCENLYFDSSCCPTSCYRYDRRLRTLLENAALKAAYRENTGGNTSCDCGGSISGRGPVHARGQRRPAEIV